MCVEEIRNSYVFWMETKKNQMRNFDLGGELILKLILRKLFWSALNWLRMEDERQPSVNIMYLTRLITIRNTFTIPKMWCFYRGMLSDAVRCRLWWKPASQGAPEWHPVDAYHGWLFRRHGWTNDFNHVAVVSLLTYKPPHQSVNINSRCEGECGVGGGFSVIPYVGFSPCGIIKYLKKVFWNSAQNSSSG
jgi:hypothetical protein